MTETNAPTTIVELPETMRSSMRRGVNRELMVHWINADLIKRSSFDVETSTVLYDPEGLFVMAVAEPELNDRQRQAIFDATRQYSKITYVSKGI